MWKPIYTFYKIKWVWKNENLSVKTNRVLERYRITNRVREANLYKNIMTCKNLPWLVILMFVAATEARRAVPVKTGSGDSSESMWVLLEGGGETPSSSLSKLSPPSPRPDRADDRSSGSLSLFSSISLRFSLSLSLSSCSLISLISWTWWRMFSRSCRSRSNWKRTNY